MSKVLTAVRRIPESRKERPDMTATVSKPANRRSAHSRHAFAGVVVDAPLVAFNAAPFLSNLNLRGVK